METLGEAHDAYLQEIRKRIGSEIVVVDHKHNEVASLLDQDGPQERGAYLRARLDLKELQKSCHPGFVIPFDNIDLLLLRKNMTMNAPNHDFHWVNHSMVENRVSGNHLSTKKEKGINDIPNIQFLPSIGDQKQERMNYIVLVSRILVDYFDC